MRREEAMRRTDFDDPSCDASDEDVFWHLRERGTRPEDLPTRNGGSCMSSG